MKVSLIVSSLTLAVIATSPVVASNLAGQEEQRGGKLFCLSESTVHY
jgi:hypothetical protein